MIIKDNSRAVGFGIASAVATASIVSALNPLSKIDLNLKNIFSNVTLIMISLMRHYFGNFMPIQPSVVMAGIPMSSPQEVSHAMSDRILKYRATGGIFLAHQPGGEQTLRIVGKAFGKSRYLFLTMLDFLFLYGSTKVVDMFADAPNLTGLGIPPTHPYTSIIDPTKELVPQVDPWTEINASNVDEGREEQHLTFPVITRSKIYTNMYIETYDFTESIENGMNCVTYTIFLRKYIADYPYKYSWFKNEHGDILWFYSEDKDDNLISKARAIDLMMEFGFSTAMIMYRFFQHLAGNSIETSIGYVTGININEENLGKDNITQSLQKMYIDLDYDLTELNVLQKQELMQID